MAQRPLGETQGAPGLTAQTTVTPIAVSRPTEAAAVDARAAPSGPTPVLGRPRSSRSCSGSAWSCVVDADPTLLASVSRHQSPERAMLDDKLRRCGRAGRARSGRSQLSHITVMTGPVRSPRVATQRGDQVPSRRNHRSHVQTVRTLARPLSLANGARTTSAAISRRPSRPGGGSSVSRVATVIASTPGRPPRRWSHGRRARRGRTAEPWPALDRSGP